MKSIDQQIVEKLQKVKSNTLIGKSIQLFCKDLIVRKEIPIIVAEVKAQIKDNEPVMMFILGAADLLFFKKLKLKP